MPICKFSKILLFSLLMFFIFPLSSFSQTEEETLTITTYYPAPYGVYNEMRSKRMAVGTNYYNGSAYPWDTGGGCTGNEICNADLVVQGNVGIGPTNPPDTEPAGTLQLPADAGGLTISGHMDSSPNRYFIDLKRRDQVEAGGGIRWRGSDNSILWQIAGQGAGTSGIHFKEGTTDRVVIRNNGNVGIGTTAPDATLQVNGTMKVFGSWISKSADTVYQASTDGMVVCESSVSNTFAGYTDGNNPPTTVRTRNAYGLIGSGITMPVRKGDYWKVTASGASYNIYWIPFGN